MVTSRRGKPRCAAQRVVVSEKKQQQQQQQQKTSREPVCASFMHVLSNRHQVSHRAAAGPPSYLPLLLRWTEVGGLDTGSWKSC